MIEFLAARRTKTQHTNVSTFLAAGAAVDHVNEYERTPLDEAHLMRDVNPEQATFMRDVIQM